MYRIMLTIEDETNTHYLAEDPTDDFLSRGFRPILGHGGCYLRASDGACVGISHISPWESVDELLKLRYPQLLRKD